jgi:hypothetical protein
MKEWNKHTQSTKQGDLYHLSNDDDDKNNNNIYHNYNLGDDK